MAAGTRIVKDMTEFADFITEIGGGWRTTFVYLNIAGFRGTAEKVDLGQLSTAIDADQKLDPEVASTLRGFANGPQKRSNRFPYAGVLKAAKYTLNWQSARSHKEKYGKYVKNADNLADRYAAMILKRQGIDPSQYDEKKLDKIHIKPRIQTDYEKQEAGITGGKTSDERKDKRDFVDYGKGGMYIRPNDNDRAVFPQDMKNVTPGGTDYYLINSDGSIAGGKPVSLSILQQILSPKSGGDRSKAKALRELGANDEEIEQYTKEFAELGWEENDYLQDQILYAVGSCTDEYHSGQINKVIFYNKWLINNITKGKVSVPIKPEEFMAIAKKEINDVYGVEVEAARRMFNRIINECFKPKKQLKLTEAELKQIVKEAAMKIVKNILSENKRRR